MKIRLAAAVAAILVASGSGGAAQAGVYTDDLGKCLVRSSSDADRTGLVVWLFATISTHPAVRSYANITPAQRVENDKRFVALFERLVTVDCRKEAVEAVRNEGAQSFEGAFRLLGEVAMRTLMSDPTVAGNLAGLDKYMDKSKFESLGKEAEVQSKPSASPK